MCRCNRTIFIRYPSQSTHILVLLLFIPIVTAWWWPLSLRSLTVTSCYCVPLGDFLSCLRSSLLPLSLSLSFSPPVDAIVAQPAMWCFIFLLHSFYTPLFILRFLTLFISSHPFTQRIYKRTEERRRLRSTQETHRRTLTHKHKHFEKGKESLLLGTKTSETHSGQLQYWITTAGRSDVCVSVVWGGREPGQDSVFGPSPMGPQRLRTESYSETSTVRGEIPALSSLHLSHPERTTAQRGTGQVDHGGRFAC